MSTVRCYSYKFENEKDKSWPSRERSSVQQVGKHDNIIYFFIIILYAFIIFVVLFRDKITDWHIHYIIIMRSAISHV